MSFVPHDLRRTAASHMTGMGISRLVVSKLLNHVERGVTAVYDRHSYDQEKRAALEAWGAHLERIIGSYNYRRQRGLISECDAMSHDESTIIHPTGSSLPTTRKWTYFNLSDWAVMLSHRHALA